MLTALLVLAAVRPGIHRDVDKRSATDAASLLVERAYDGERQSGLDAMRFRRLQMLSEDGTINTENWPKARDQVLELRRASLDPAPYPQSAKLAGGLDPMSWESIGPGTIGGRIRSLVFDPDDPRRIYVGGVSGGIWVSRNGGEPVPVSEGWTYTLGLLLQLVSARRRLCPEICLDARQPKAPKRCLTPESLHPCRAGAIAPLRHINENQRDFSAGTVRAFSIAEAVYTLCWPGNQYQQTGSPVRKTIMKATRNLCVAGALTALSGTALAEISANATMANNYIWRGLTQTTNDAAVQGGLDYAHESGFYVGTWVSNVKYAPADVFSYEHDIYFGYSGGDTFTYDIGWLYYNYDDEAEFDFHEIYGSIGYQGFSLTGFVLSGTEADEAPGQDFGFGSTYYLSLDYSTELSNGFGIGAHVGRHAGDFNEAFNGVPGDYTDYNINFSVKDFTFMISGTDLDDPGPDNLDNDAVKFVIAYSVEFGL